MEPGAHGEILSLAFAGDGQHQDAGGKVVHAAPNTTSTIISKSLSKGGGRTSYRGLLKVYEGCENVEVERALRRAAARRDSRSDTYPMMEIDAGRCTSGTRPTVSKLGEDQLFYLMSRGMTEEAGGQDDRQRLRRADRQGTADGVRRRAQPPDRAADGRRDRLGGTPVASASPAKVRRTARVAGPN